MCSAPCVVRRRDRDGRDPELAAGAEDAHRDLAAVRYEELPDAHPGAPLLEEGPQPVLPLGARPPLGGAREQVLLVARLEDEPLRLADGGRAAGEDVRDDALDRRVEVLGDLVDEADPERRRRVEPLAGEEVAAGRRRADLRQHHRRDHRRDDPEPHLGEPEDRVLGGDRDVGAGDVRPEPPPSA